MSETDVKISSCLFGGYDKRTTDVYIEELQETIMKLEKDLRISSDMNAKYAKKMNEAESYYRALWERNKEQTSVIERQKNELKTNENVIKVQKEKVRARDDAARHQEELLREKDEKIKFQQEQLSGLNDKVQKSDEQMRELELKLEQKVQQLKEREEMTAKLKDRIGKQQRAYEEYVRRHERMLSSKLEQFMQESIKMIGRRKR